MTELEEDIYNAINAFHRLNLFFFKKVFYKYRTPKDHDALMNHLLKNLPWANPLGPIDKMWEFLLVEVGINGGAQYEAESTELRLEKNGNYPELLELFKGRKNYNFCTHTNQ